MVGCGLRKAITLLGVGRPVVHCSPAITQSIRRDKIPGVPGGNRGRPDWALITERLEAAGYRSYHSGKWHVDGNPLSRGFALSHRGGQNDFFDPAGITVDGKPVEETDQFYVTTAVGEHGSVSS